MTMFIKNLVFKALNSIVIPIKKQPIEFISKILALLGGYYSLCEIEQATLKTTVLLDVFRNSFWFFILFIILIAVLLHKKPLVHSDYLGTKDIIMSLRIANLFALKDSAIVIPTNTTFDTAMDRDFISIKSIQGQFQKKYYGTDFSELDAAIKDEFVSRNMTICIYPSSLSEANVTWESLCNYMDWQCAFFSENQKHITTSNTTGTPIGKKEHVTTK